jgi:hypothetical protein
MSFNPIGAIGGAISGAISGLFGGSPAGSSSSMDPLTLENALAEQGSAFTNINTLSSLAQSQPQSDKLLASLIDGDDSE